MIKGLQNNSSFCRSRFSLLIQGFLIQWLLVSQIINFMHPSLVQVSGEYLFKIPLFVRLSMQCRHSSPALFLTHDAAHGVDNNRSLFCL